MAAIDVASYIYNRYMEETGNKIDEMKLHKLLYFAQREWIAQTGEPLFNEKFYGWKFGPVLKEIRDAYRTEAFSENQSNFGADFQAVMDGIFLNYASKSSWSLSRLTHGELSWLNSRLGIPDGENGDNPLSLDDIRKDAERIKKRRTMLDDLGLR